MCLRTKSFERNTYYCEVSYFMKDYSLVRSKNKLRPLTPKVKLSPVALKLLAPFLMLMLPMVSPAQTLDQEVPPPTKSDTTIILISDLHVQLECTQALNDLYNFNFQRAEFQFKYLKSRYGWHPLPYFLMGLIEWWKIMPNTKDTSHDDTFFAYMDSSIVVGEKLYKKYPAYKTEAALSFCLASKRDE